jgi:hypothetical protein
MNKIIFLLLFFITSNTSATLFKNKVEIYDCLSRDNAGECNAKCKKSGVSIEFKVDTKEKKIMLISYEDGKQTGSTVIESDKYKKCNIFDQKNWECKTTIPSSQNLKFTMSTSSMANGIFFNEFISGDTRTYQCGR